MPRDSNLSVASYRGASPLPQPKTGLTLLLRADVNLSAFAPGPAFDEQTNPGDTRPPFAQQFLRCIKRQLHHQRPRARP
ncbi:protein of unknown function [Pseudomonas sp. JV241A]|nr:protein of unknown function [Pseudomonas sp. JV241A]